MARAATSNMNAHLAQRVTTLATLWKITRQDGTVLRFTDHDQDLTFDSEAYESMDGYDRSQIITRLDFSPDNFSVRGLLTTTGFTEADIRALEYDGASVEIRIVNWQDTSASMGSILYQSGDIGQVVVKRPGEYEAEARGLSQRYSKRVGNVVGLACRADLFDAKCSNPNVTDSVQQSDFEVQRVVASVSSNRLFTLEPEGVGSDLDLQSGQANSVDITPGDGSVVYDPTAPDGTAAHPYEISTADELQALDNTTSAGVYYVQTADIDLSSVTGGTWSQLRAFAANYDGQGYRIHTYTGAVARQGGVFAVITGTVKNLNVESLDFSYNTGTDNAGILAGTISTGATVQDIAIKDCTITLNATTHSANVGGLAGEHETDAVAIKRCLVEVTPTDNTTTLSGKTGGVIGESNGSGASLQSQLFYNADFWTFSDTDPSNQNVGYEHYQMSGIAPFVDTTEYPADRFDFENVWHTYSSRATNGATLTFNASAGTITRASGDFTTDGYTAGDTVEIRRCPLNRNRTVRVGSVTASTITIDKGTLVDETAALGHLRGYAAGLHPRVINRTLTDGVLVLTPYNLDKLLGVYATSTLTWTETTPGSSTVAVHITKDFITWSAATSGMALPGFSVSDSLAGYKLGIRITLTPEGSNYPSVDSMSLVFETDNPGLDLTDEYYKFGAVKWTSGANLDRSMEVKASDASTGVLTLFLKMASDIQVGDTFRLLPGCAKDLSTCFAKFNNVKNLRGEPYTPGADYLFQIHTATSGNGGNTESANAAARTARDLDVTA